MQHSMRLTFLASVVVVCRLAAGLELHPGGALVPEETAEVAEARSLHATALQAAAAFSADEEEEFDDVDYEVERQEFGSERGCPCYRRQCCRQPHCWFNPYCRVCPPGVRCSPAAGPAPDPNTDAMDEEDEERQGLFGRFCPCFFPRCCRFPHCRFRPICRRFGPPGPFLGGAVGPLAGPLGGPRVPPPVGR